ncbi:N-acetylmuramoyl-L-alanine amidase [Algicella marina]|uniref:MurNAc-LAA domain-containing protein n=1 Tax=Algicella marina TaxID=2683284 RepID=A0A6P1SYZ4_9RHOB|nr:N-acetylmuramoyl-L-alanine amidase [Algicella marina]QHQ34745.1 hypothetical protein GO499_05825 [Algicella marina]
MKLAIIIGHNSVRQGANGTAPISQSEFNFNSEVAEIMDAEATLYGIDAKIFRRRNRTSTRAEIEEVYGRSDDWGADLSVELHFNAFNGTVRGTETLCGPSQASLQAATSIHMELLDLYDRTVSEDRGLKPYRPGMRGGLSLISGRAPAVLVEPFFGDNAAEARLAMDTGIEALAKAYVTGVAGHFGTTPLMAGVPTATPDLAHLM